MMALANCQTVRCDPVNFLVAFFASEDNFSSSWGLFPKKGSKSTNMANLRMLPLVVLAGTLLGVSVSSAQTSRITATPANRIVTPINDAQVITIHGTVSPRANSRNDLGAAPDGMQLNRMHLVLKRSDSQETALKQLIDEQHTPGSPNYHKWLTPEQFGAQFGPSDQDITTVTTWLTNHGFNVSKVNPGHQTIEISGSVAQLRNAFHTQIHAYSINGQTRYANANDPQIPAALAPVVAGFVSLNNFPVRSYAETYGKAIYDPATNKATPQWTMGTSSAMSFVLSPGDFATQYDLNPLYTAGVNGTGQSIAIVNESNININLVNQFRSLFSLPANPVQVIIDGNDPGIDGINNPSGPNFASTEAYLDVEWAGAAAPNATIDLVIAGDTALQSGLVLAAERAIYSNIAPIISVSFGACEKNLASSNPFLSSLWQQAAAQGITVIVSSGDSGSAGCDNDTSSGGYAVNGQAVNGFASTPYNVAVGGTDFYYSQYAAGGSALSTQISGYWNTTPTNSSPTVSLLGYIPEQPWNASQYGLNIIDYYNATGSTTISGGGGGASNAALCANNSYSTSTGQCTTTLSGYPKPAWQTGVAGIPNDGVRDIPDVSLFASSGINASYYPLCASDGDCQPASSGGTVQISGVGGTSASAPAFAGIMALVNQKYGRQGNANTVLYPLAKQFPNSFHDVTNGTISVPCQVLPTISTDCISVTNPITITTSSGSITEGQIGTGTTPEYNATTGYDLATGLGTIDAANLVNNWGSVTLASTTTTMSASTTTLTHGSPVTISGNVTGTGTPTGTVALMTDSSEQSQQAATKFTLASGAYTGTTSNLPGGTYNIWTQYSGDGANGMSTSQKTQVTVSPEASTIDFNIFSGSNHYAPGTPPTTQVDYGTQFMLSALVAPSSQAATLQTCVISGTGCSSVSFTSPTGTVTFADNGSAINTAAINSEGDAEYNAPFSVGAHSVTAAYAGDKSYNAATTTSPIAFTVVKDTPTFLLDASALYTDQSTQTTSGVNGPNQPLVLTLQVMNGAQVTAATPNNATSCSSTSLAPVPVAPPTGTVTVTGLPSSVTTTSVTLLPGVDPSGQGGCQAVQGLANFTIPAGTTSGTYNVTFNYSGDSNYNSTSNSYTIPVVNTSGSGQNSTITATISGTTTTPNAALNVTGTVTGTSAGAKAPTGTVDVYASGYYIAAFTLNAPTTGITSSFSGQLNSSSIPQGANQITLQYEGDTIYNPSAYTLNSGSPISNPLSDFTMVPNLANVPVTAGNSGTANIYLTSVNGFTGTVGLSCTATGVTCSIPASSTLTNGGNASVTVTLTAPSSAANGTHNVVITGKDSTGQYIHTVGITAMVSGSTSSTAGFTLTNNGNITVAAGATSGNTSVITVNPTNGFTGAVGLTCAVTSSPSGATSPVTCAVSPTSVNITSGALTSTLTVSSTSTTTTGSYAVTVTGTSGTITETSVVNVTVTAATAGTFALSSSGNITVTRGATTGNTSTITVTPSGGFTGTVTLTCAISPTASSYPAGCQLSPASVTITGTSAGTSTLTISTTAATAFNEPLKIFWPATGGGAVLAVLFFFVPRRRRNWLAMMALLVVLASGIAIGCGGGSSNNGGGTTTTGTSPGTYTVTVTGTSGSITKTATVTLTVN